MTWWRSGLGWAAAVAVVGLTACSSDSEPEKAPSKGGPMYESLPFEFTRAPVGTEPSAAEVTAFTKKITGFWKQVDYFRWCSWHSHGLDASYDPNMPDYKLWWQDTKAVKEGDKIIFRHTGGADNIMIRTPKVLTQAITGYVVSGDPIMRELVIQYAKGIVALFQGMVWSSEQLPTESITARAIFTHNHSYTTNDGRKIEVDYDPVKVEKYDWNAHTVPNDDNPYFGKIWVRNMRSKDDVPHMFRVVPLLMRLAQDTEDEEVRMAAQNAVDHMTAFGRDIVDHEYHIRTNEVGNAYIPTEDLASFVTFEVLLPNAECNAKLASALLGYGGPKGNDCGMGVNLAYEDIAGDVHYFNLAIIRYFHLAAITNALAFKEKSVAKKLLEGLVERVDAMVSDQKGPAENQEWNPDMASYLLAAGASGLPLTAREARIVQEQYAASVDHYEGWAYWDLWDESVPDGEYDYLPPREGQDGMFVRPEEMAFLMEYCGSAWKNPSSVDLVDCSVVLDPSRWGN